MSFITPSQRGFENTSDLASSAPDRIQHSAQDLHSYDDFCALPSQQQQQHQNGPPSSADQSTMPKVGETRCYWSLLSSELNFLYLDPVLANHLGEQAIDLINKPLLAFVHPDEQASARQDLGSVLTSRTLHGSVTRVRYSRLSSVRRQLGYDGPNPWSDGDKIAVDANYMAVDIVINWAAEGLVLCFMHAVVDLTPYDSDPTYKTGWTNWCGTPPFVMNREQVSLMYQRLMTAIPPSGRMERIFQILLNEQGNRQCLMSWPPDNAESRLAAKHFSKLAQDVQIGENGQNQATDAKTSCTRRYKALQTMDVPAEGLREVESIFIPHGTIIFACHKVNILEASAVTSPVGYPNSTTFAQTYYGPGYSLPPGASPPYDSYGPAQASQNVLRYQQPWSETGPGQPPHQQYGGYPNQQPWGAQPSASGPAGALPYLDPAFHPAARPLTPSYQQFVADGSDSAAASPVSTTTPGGLGSTAGTPPDANDVVPPPRNSSRRTSPGSAGARESYGSGGRSSGHPPLGVLRCSSCKATTSPEWRKGPSGKKDLCNACGLRYARSRAKKEGVTSQRRRKERSLAGSSSSAPSPVATNQPEDPVHQQMGPGPGSPVASFQGMRRSFDGPSAVPPSVAMNGMTPSPSPSPSTSSMGYAQHYPAPPSHTQNGHAAFYSPVSPTASVMHGGGAPMPLPRLESLSSFPPSSSRMSIPSPVSGSPLGAPFDRDRERAIMERERVQLGAGANGDGSAGLPSLPPTPISTGMDAPRRRA